MRNTALIILDGWGFGLQDENDATHIAHTPTVDRLLAGQHARLITHGEDVGLPAGQMGNSEVGHMNIGAGRVVYQDLLRIDRAIASGDFAKEQPLQAAMSRAAAKGPDPPVLGNRDIHCTQSYYPSNTVQKNQFHNHRDTIRKLKNTNINAVFG